jgi:hypothetical protein
MTSISAPKSNRMGGRSTAGSAMWGFKVSMQMPELLINIEVNIGDAILQVNCHDDK